MFGLSFMLMQATPEDAVFRYMCRSRIAQALMSVGCALYKLRKINFIATIWLSHDLFSLVGELCVLLLVLEAHGNLRKIEEYRAVGKLSLLGQYLVTSPRKCFKWCIDKFWPGFAAITAVLIAQEVCRMPHHQLEVFGPHLWYPGDGWSNAFQISAGLFLLWRALRQYIPLFFRSNSKNN
eukprot:TRINITY_DN19924_c0_g1_i2.p3 TRINITY_DN19924_c0_g1~~TRINITY_DN19924_c0_g1_i2.p3  ORF type:complete len:180 (+),score=35.72 TRINITY_DN19924_c0_g1_i2:139-678(+)